MIVIFITRVVMTSARVLFLLLFMITIDIEVVMVIKVTERLMTHRFVMLMLLSLLLVLLRFLGFTKRLFLFLLISATLPFIATILLTIFEVVVVILLRLLPMDHLVILFLLFVLLCLLLNFLFLIIFKFILFRLVFLNWGGDWFLFTSWFKAPVQKGKLVTGFSNVFWVGELGSIFSVLTL